MITAANEPVAIVGMACRVPGATSLDSFWEMLASGREAPTSWLPTAAARTPYKAVERSDGIDWRLLKISPKEASRLDPQQRLLLEVAWEAFDDAGLPKQDLAGTKTAVALGSMWADYLQCVLADSDSLDGYGISGATPAFLAARVSHVFDLRGPAEVVDAACCSSALAIASACRGLRLGEVDLALVGGVNLILRSGSSLLMDRAQLLSKGGRCRPLDRDADGLVRGEGVALLVLKRARDVQSHDRVYAEILGHAVAQSGRQNWIMAPAPDVQAGVIREALRCAAVAGEQISYVEMSCPGFSRGDEVEVRALNAALGGSGRTRCRVGSVKSNLGNLEGAASAIAMIKVALSLHHRAWPATLGVEHESHGLEDCQERLVAQTRLESSGEAELAGVTCVSYSGSNAHFVLSSTKSFVEVPTARNGAPHLLCLSSQTESNLRSVIAGYLDLLARPSAAEEWLRDLCFTACSRRDHFRFRCWAMGRDAGELADALRLARPAEAGEAPAVAIGISDDLAVDGEYLRGLLALPGMRDWFDALPTADRALLERDELATLAAAGALRFIGMLLNQTAAEVGVVDACADRRRRAIASAGLSGLAAPAPASAAAGPPSSRVPTLLLGDGRALPLDFAAPPSIRAALGQLFVAGAEIDFGRCGVTGRVTSTPPFVWNRDSVPVELPAEIGSRRPPTRTEAPDRRALIRDKLRALEGAARRLYVNKLVLDTGREILGLPTGENPSMRTALFELGFTSLSMVQLRTELEASLGVSVSTSQLLGCKTLADVASLLG